MGMICRPEIKTDSDVSLRADFIPGAAELMHELKRRGYRLALVADGPTATFSNSLEPYGLYEVFDVWAPRRPKTPADATEQPDYTIKAPLELLGIIDELERTLGSASGRLGGHWQNEKMADEEPTHYNHLSEHGIAWIKRVSFAR